MNILLINGSPKPRKPNSGSILDYIEKLLDGKGEVNRIRCKDTIQDENKFDEFINIVLRSDIIIIAYPLYWDSLPYVVTRTLDSIKRRREELEGKERLIMTISNCGFPEPDHIALSTRMMKRFSENTGFRWLGALEVGGGGAIGERPLTEAGGQFRYLVKAIDTSLNAILNGEVITDEVLNMMKKPSIPPWIYRNMGNFGWKMQARKKKAKVSLKHRPYDDKR